MPAVPDFVHKFGLVLKAGNLSRGRLAQAVGIDKSVVSRWASGVQAPTDHNLALLTEAVARHIKGFARTDWDLDTDAFAARLRGGATAPALPDRPSLAVLPFANLGGGAEQDYFAAGVADDIITALSRVKSLFVIARNSSFSFRDRTVDVKTVGRELGVRYVLEGSVRRAGDRLRFTAQLVDTDSAAHVWAEKYDSPAEDLFEVQDRITEAVVGVLEPALQQAEIARMRRKRPEHFGGYDHFLRGLAQTDTFTHEATEAMLQSCLRAIALDPSFAPAYALAGRAYIQRHAQGWIVDSAKESAEAIDLVERGLAADRSDPMVLATAGQVFAWFSRDLPKAVAYLDEAIAANPNYAHGLMQSGIVRTRTGDVRMAIGHLERALRLSPRDLRGYALFQAMASAQLLDGDVGAACGWARRAVQHNPNYHPGWYTLAACAVQAGHIEEARAAAVRMLELEPDFTIGKLKRRYPRASGTLSFDEALRRAGFPD